MRTLCLFFFTPLAGASTLRLVVPLDKDLYTAAILKIVGVRYTNKQVHVRSCRMRWLGWQSRAQDVKPSRFCSDQPKKKFGPRKPMYSTLITAISFFCSRQTQEDPPELLRWVVRDQTFCGPRADTPLTIPPNTHPTTPTTGVHLQMLPEVGQSSFPYRRHLFREACAAETIFQKGGLRHAHCRGYPGWSSVVLGSR
jgi:hypothetical protein